MKNRPFKLQWTGWLCKSNHKFIQPSKLNERVTYNKLISRNTLPKVRGEVLSKFLTAYKRSKYQRDKTEFKDRHEGTFFDGYTKEQFDKVIVTFMIF